MKRWIFLLVLPFLFISAAYSIEKQASILHGRIVTSDPTAIEVFILDNDGSILDLGSLTKDGTFKLDLSVMDEPVKAEVYKLTLEVKKKTGSKRRFPLKPYIKKFDDTVELKPIIFN